MNSKIEVFCFKDDAKPSLHSNEKAIDGHVVVPHVMQHFYPGQLTVDRWNTRNLNLPRSFNPNSDITYTDKLTKK